MPNSSPSPGADVRAILASVQPEATLTDAAVKSDYPPLLLMRTKHLMAAFGFGSGDIRESYEALYGGFKNYYAAQQGEWDALDLAFVFCVQSDSVQLDQFCSNVETNVYFCRKFVIPLSVPLSTSLARLPFLPLTPPDGQPLRPPSAQTLLQQCGLPPVLAKYLVVQQQRSPEGIVADCTTGKFGELRRVMAPSAMPVPQTERATEPVRLETLEIRNFRAYRNPQTFALGADVTVLYGPNGFGKTSFFDALDFAITGGIGRLKSGDQSEFAKIARHLDAGSKESTVSFTFRCNDAVHEVVRSVSNRNRALLDGTPTDRKTILAELTSGNTSAADRVENFVSLFRASHLFSQEQQELTKDFQEDCLLPADIVSRMLAFEDYANAVKKLAKVHDVLRATIAEADEEIESLSDQIAVDTKELERLSGTAKGHANIGALDTEIAALRTKLAAAGIAVLPGETDATMLRGWRAALESQLAQSQATNERLSGLAREVAGLPRLHEQLTAVRQRLAIKEQGLKAAEENRIPAELAVQDADQQVADIAAKQMEARARAASLEWARNNQPGYARLVAQLRELGEELQAATKALSELRVAEDKAVGELRSRETDAAQVAENLETQRADFAGAQELQQKISAWQSNRTRLARVVEGESAQLEALELLRTEEREIVSQLATMTAQEQRLVRQIAEADRNQSELKTLVSQLQGHVHTGVCPLCGEDHGSKDHLLQRIQAHVESDPASRARVDLTSIRERVEELANRVAASKQEQQSANDQLAILRSERAKLEAEIAGFATAATKLAIAAEATEPPPADQVSALVTRLHQEVVDLDKQALAAGAAVMAARVVAANAKQATTARNMEVDERESLQARVQEEIDRLRTDPRWAQVAIDSEPSHLAELEQVNLTHLENLKVEMAKVEVDANQKKADVETLRRAATSLQKQLQDLRRESSNLQQAISQITIRLEESGLPTDSNEESVLTLIADESRRQAQLLALRDAASGLELAMDAATTAAALTTLQRTVRKKQEAVKEAQAKRDRHQPWLRYFDEVTRLVASQQEEATANFTREYGPRTSIIQRRLRSVYGFDDIEIKSRESAISVRVIRHNEELRPTDYFSQSQQQTLFLALFLTACTSQTWSAFSPVFLDDPVTHFDDLNTYAFLDLVVGLLESDGENRQFIISTCDDKLLQLARQKFRHLGERARFYEFTAFGAEGPTVNEWGRDSPASEVEPRL